MQQLTQEQAERCFIACGGTNPHTPGVIVEEYALPNGYHTFLLPLDPYFWFPKLWERLVGFIGTVIPQQQYYGGPPPNLAPTEKSDTRIMDVSLAYPRGDNEYLVAVSGSAVSVDWDGYLETALHPHPCLALCAAIEALEKEEKP